MWFFFAISDKLSGLVKHRETDFDRMVDAAGVLAQRVRDTWDGLLIQYPPQEGTIVHEIPTLWNRPRNTVRIWRTDSDLVISTACLAMLDRASNRDNYRFPSRCFRSEQGKSGSLYLVCGAGRDTEVTMFDYRARRLNETDPASFIQTHVIPIGSFGVGMDRNGILLQEFRELLLFPEPPGHDICERVFRSEEPYISISYQDKIPIREEVENRVFDPGGFVSGSHQSHSRTIRVYLHKKAYPVLIDLVPEAVRHSPVHQAECLFALGLLTEQEYVERINKIESEKES